MSKDLTNAHPTLIEFFSRLKTWYEGKFDGRTLEVLSVDRTPKEQLQLFTQGRLDTGERVTEKDGYNARSRHNYFPSHAIDVVVKCNGVVAWNEDYYHPIGLAIFQLGYSGEIRWGGIWRDFGHIEVR